MPTADGRSFYALAVTDALVEAADGCPMMRRAVALAGWVGDGRPVTSKGVLKPVDIPGAMAAMGLVASARARTAADVEALHRPWVAAQAVGLVEVRIGRAVATGSTPADGLEAWWAALGAVLRAESHDREGEGASVLCRTLLAVLAGEPALDDVEDLVNERLHDASGGWYIGAVYQAFRRGVMPVDAGAQLLGEFGAVDEGLRLTALGRWAEARFAASAPQPVSADLPATDLLERLVGLAEREAWDVVRQWLAGRDVNQAAAEVMSAAEQARPAARVAGMDLVGGLGEAMRPVWRSALKRPMLAPHARAALATWEAPDRAPSEADHRWLAVEYALAVEDAEEAWHLVDEFGGLPVVTASTHPDAGALLEALNAAGPPPRRVYQLKVSLVNVRPPVWRRLRVPAALRLDALHYVIQAAFGWRDDHLHLFEAGHQRYADADFELDDCDDESGVRLAKVLSGGGAMKYVYDMGDWWEHRITVERVDQLDDPAADVDIVCSGGRGDAPIEDWNPEDGPHTTPFDVDAINRRLTALFVPSA
ncbi:plasmid pRiA4b ORF-3 family protein [Dactylosporangium sp. CA-139066]|uniref:plasmid pRiA4b ORF-3 family protein n=1 Tax=Dactylosporangium sp. CA-139066 TaxID=3239930 RepID=UPI003D8C6109